ncbi:MAG: HNH endonuclease signature motif containing protein [Pseudomonadota bacterium]
MPLKSATPKLKRAGSRLRPPAKHTEPFYRSKGHLAWAARVKRRAGYTCERCGAAGDGVRLIADHIVERKDAGAPFDDSNGACLCQACHNTKTARAKRARNR